ncbi:MAG: hypothetical protein U0520_00325 [Candidatus Saccharimonadales bacterium]
MAKENERHSNQSASEQTSNVDPALLRRLQYLIARKYVDTALADGEQEAGFTITLPLDTETGALRLNVDRDSAEVCNVPAKLIVNRSDNALRFIFAPADSGVQMSAPYDAYDYGPLQPLDGDTTRRYSAFEVLAVADGSFTLLGHMNDGIVEFPPDSDEPDGSKAIGKIVAVCGLVVEKVNKQEMTVL